MKNAKRFDVEKIKREQVILDKGYDAVRTMAKEMVENGATLSDMLFHANQVWHEFKVGAIWAGMVDVAATGMYMGQYNRFATNKIISADERYKGGLDAVRVAIIQSAYELPSRTPVLPAPSGEPLNPFVKAGQ